RRKPTRGDAFGVSRGRRTPFHAARWPQSCPRQLRTERVMDSLRFLRSMLSEAVDVAEKPLAACEDIDRVVERLTDRIKAGDTANVPLDLQREAVRQFWRTMRFDSLKQARLASFGLCLPSGANAPSILDDAARFGKLLAGVDQWVKDPRR